LCSDKVSDRIQLESLYCCRIDRIPSIHRAKTALVAYSTQKEKMTSLR